MLTSFIRMIRINFVFILAELPAKLCADMFTTCSLYMKDGGAGQNMAAITRRSDCASAHAAVRSYIRFVRGD
jgi:hypothetical protein